MSFAAALNRFAVKVRNAPPLVLAGVTTRMHQSIVGTGQADPLTGAPGQPVDTGFLKNSWTQSVTPTEGRIQTNAAYARQIEDGVTAKGTAITFRSKVGGAHSVKLTIAAADRIQADVVRGLAR